MALLISEEDLAAGIVEVAEGLFREMTSFGVLASGQSIILEQLEQFGPRVAMLATILELGETAGLHFGDEPFPYWYNRVRWDPSLPVAGFTNKPGGPKPSQVLWSMVGAWNMVVSDPSQSSRDRLLRATLWQTSQEDLWSGLQLAIALSDAGFLLNSADLAVVVRLLLSGRDLVASDREMVSRFFGDAIPASPSLFLDADFSTDWVAERPLKSPAATDLVQRIVGSLFKRLEGARHSQSMDEWMLNQQRLHNCLAPLLAAIRSLVPQMPLALQTMMTQLGEVNADAGSAAMNAKTKLAGDPSYASLLFAAMPVMSQFRARLGDEWEDRLYNERVLIPEELRSLMFDIEGTWSANVSSMSKFIGAQVARQRARCPSQWQGLSWALAYPFVCVLRPELRDPALMSGDSPRPEDVARHPSVTGVLAKYGVKDPEVIRQSIIRAEKSRPGRFLTDRDCLLIERVREVASGAIPLAIETDLHASQSTAKVKRPSPMEDELVQAVADATAELHQVIFHEAISQVMESLGRSKPNDALATLLALQSVYPWSASGYETLAVVLYGMADLTAASKAIRIALTLQPSSDQPWRLLASILEETAGREQSRGALAMADRWKTLKAN